MRPSARVTTVSSSTARRMALRVSADVFRDNQDENFSS